MVSFIRGVKMFNYLTDDTKIINLTKHDIYIFAKVNENDKLIPVDNVNYKERFSLVNNKLKIIAMFPKHEGNTPRCSTSTKQLQKFKGIPIIKYEFGEVSNLPPEKEGVRYIVSARTGMKAKLAGRNDLFIPSFMVLNAESKIVGCMQLAVN